MAQPPDHTRIDQLKRTLGDALPGHQLDGARDVILSRAELCFHIVRGAEAHDAPLGASRIGGEPDLPDGMEWPAHAMPAAILGITPGEMRYGNFIAQLDLAEVARACSSDLPDAGILSIFVTEEWGAASPVCLALRHHHGSGALSRRPSKPAGELCSEYLVDLVPHRLSFSPGLSLPRGDQAFLSAVNERTPEIVDPEGRRERGSDRLHDLVHDLKPRDTLGQLLGHAVAHDERDDLYRQVALTRLGHRNAMYASGFDSMDAFEQFVQLSPSTAAYREEVRWRLDNEPAIASEASGWRLLFRFDSDLAVDLNICDSDPFFGFIRSSDLAIGDFSDAVGEELQG